MTSCRKFAKSQYLAISRWGVGVGMRTQLAKRITLTNQIAMFLFLCCLFIPAISYFQKQYVNMVCNMLFLALMLAVLFLNKSGKYYASRHLATNGVGFLAGIQSVVVIGPIGALNQGYYAWMLLPFVLFERQDRIHLLVCCVLTYFYFLCTEFVAFPWLSAHVLPPFAAYWFHFIVSTLFFALIGFTTFRFLALNHLAESSLERVVIELRDEKEMVTRLHGQLDAQRAQNIQKTKMAALGEMAGGIAHEINTPLSIIQMSAHQLDKLMHEPELNRVVMAHRMTAIVTTVNRVAKIIAGLRNFSRDASADPMRAENVAQIIENTLSLCHEKIKKIGIKLTIVNLDPELMVQCRSVEISQVLLNLFSNAIDAVTELPIKWITVQSRLQVGHAEIAVVDSGTGIAKENEGKIFQPFFTTKDIGKGTGLGLSISKGIIESHHGALTLDAASRNTRFVVTLPLHYEVTEPAASDVE